MSSSAPPPAPPAGPGQELSKALEPAAIQGAVDARWQAARAFAAVPGSSPRKYVVMMPLPNVTGALHMGHAMDNVMQDLLTRWHRMQGDDTLWQPGTDHAGIATQAVVEKRLFQLEQKTRKDVGREALVARIWAWKDEYAARIVRQQKAMGCGCDWDRQRFTMDAVCSAAVREAFFSMFKDKLIYRGDRLVNWDCKLETAVADDEMVPASVKGNFYYLKYPVIDPRPGEPTHVVVATTRPETMLGDTAVACHPDPRAALDAELAEARATLAKAKAKEQAPAKAELDRLEARKESHLAALETLAAMAKDGRKVRLPLQERAIPLIADGWAKPGLGSGCVKITPAHDPNDYEVWKRHKSRIDIVNILEPNGTLNRNGGKYAGLDRAVARKKVVADLEALDLVEKIEERDLELQHSERSGTVIEPYVSKQWFVRMGDLPGGVTFGRGTPREHKGAGLAQAAIDAAGGTWKSPTGLQLRFHPDERYAATYTTWLAEKRDWCISRQLWWGHQIPVWAGTFDAAGLSATALKLPRDPQGLHVWASDASGAQFTLLEACAWADQKRLGGAIAAGPPGPIGPETERLELQVCLRGEAAQAKHAAALEALGLARDPDVLDTWFSSALWPFSTLGWPSPADAKIEPGQTPLGPQAGRAGALEAYFPGSCLVTGRDIITLWVARMAIFGLYCLGDLPFTDVFVHANIQDGKGERMSKSAGNGIDPLDIIASHGVDAMRYVLCEMQTGSQDIRIPVQAISPFTKKLVELTTAKVGRSSTGHALKGTYVDPDTGEPFDVVGTYEGIAKASTTSERFDVGRNFCNKLWNGARFAMQNLAPEGAPLGFDRLDRASLPVEDRWILSLLTRATQAVQAGLEAYNPSQAITAARDFFWNDFCDWYVEMVKTRLKDPVTAQAARQVLAVTLDQTLRLLHPMLPFVTEAIWENLGAVVPVRGIDRPLPASTLCVKASWPEPRTDWLDPAVEAEVEQLRATVRGVRDIRASYSVPPSKRLEARVQGPDAAIAVLERLKDHLVAQAGLSAVVLAPRVDRPANAASKVVGDLEVFLGDVLDPAKEKVRLEKEKANLEKNIASTGKKLETPSFVDKAPPAVVEAERKRLADLKKQLQAVIDALGRL